MRRREISAREAYVMAVGARFGDVFLLPATKGVDDGRFIVARIGCDGRVSCE